MGFDMEFGYSGFDGLFFLVFLFIVGVFIAVIVKGVSTWNKNNNSPRLTVTAKVVSKRMEVSHHNHANAGDVTGAHGYSTTSSTWHYVTFQVESGDRMEFSVYRFRVWNAGGRGCRKAVFSGNKIFIF